MRSPDRLHRSLPSSSDSPPALMVGMPTPYDVQRQP
jgi:hypothetical protein